MTKNKDNANTTPSADEAIAAIMPQVVDPAALAVVPVDVAPAAPSVPTFTLPQAFIDSVVVQAQPMLEAVKTIDERLTVVRGNVVEQKRAAVEALRATEGETVLPDDTTTEDKQTALPFTYLDELALQLDELVARVEEQKQACEGAIMSYLRSKHEDTTVQQTALLDQRKILVTQLEGMVKLGVPLEIPSAPKGTRSSGGGTRAKSSTGRHYVVNGEADHRLNKDVEAGARYFPANDSFSYIAWMFNKCGTDALRKALTDAGIENELDAWDTTLTIGGKTLHVGHEVTEG